MPRMRKYGESKTTQIMMATVPYVTSGSGLRKFQADGFFSDRVYDVEVNGCFCHLATYKFGVFQALRMYSTEEQWIFCPSYQQHYYGFF